MSSAGAGATKPLIPRVGCMPKVRQIEASARVRRLLVIAAAAPLLLWGAAQAQQSPPPSKLPLPKADPPAKRTGKDADGRPHSVRQCEAGDERAQESGGGNHSAGRDQVHRAG